MHTSVLPKLRQFLAKYEGICSFMYLDKRQPKGLVTTGIGNLIDPKSLVHSYRWIRRSDKRPASRNEVEQEWDRIKALQKHKLRGGGYFEQFTRLKLAPGEIDRIFTQKANQFDKNLKRIFPKWDTFPAEAQFAMLIHAWANGTGKLKTGWPSYYNACLRRDWTTAANQCSWKGIDSGRLQHMKQLFNDAAKKDRRI